MSEQEQSEQEQTEQAAAEAAEQASAAEAASEEAAVEESDQAAELEQLRTRLEQTEKKLAEADARAQAEMQNVRRRAEKDVEAAHKFALEKFSSDLLSVADTLERALASLDESEPALQPAREGTELTFKSLLDVLSRHGVERIDPTGEAFDPEQHEAMTMVPSEELEPNHVVEVLEKGYLLNGRLLRPARVVVSKSE